MLQTQSASDPSSKISMINYLSAVDAGNEEWQDMGTGLPSLNNSVNMEDNLQMTFIHLYTYNKQSVLLYWHIRIYQVTCVTIVLEGFLNLLIENQNLLESYRLFFWFCFKFLFTLLS